MTEIALVCGGPSQERGISLNSARSVMDNLSGPSVRIHPLYVDQKLNFYAISCSQLYSNTPSDFDFKLPHTAERLTHSTLQARLKSMHIVFPAIHGAFGEDGGLQKLFESMDVPFVGPSSAACQRMFHKHNASKILKGNGFNTLPSVLLRANCPEANNDTIHSFFKKNQLQRAIIKPVSGGSSIGVFSVNTAEEAIESARYLFENKIDNESILEPFCNGQEFTIVVLENLDGQPVALIPTEIEVSYEDNQILNYRRKYLPTSNTFYHTPPRFPENIIRLIQSDAEKIFKLFGMRDFGRLDGWLMNDGGIYFTDLNPISGMEQNSFLFRQSSLLGITHHKMLWSILMRAAHREKLSIEEPLENSTKGKEVRVLFGGKTAERQISLMSGTNVWLKLRRSDIYNAEPYLLDKNGDAWHLPYSYALNHTIEEIYDNCLTAEECIDKLESLVDSFYESTNHNLLPHNVRAHLPEKMTLHEFLEDSRKMNAFVFLGLHGGDGENGHIQNIIEQYNISYNGSGPKTSELCMDKYLTGERITAINHPHLKSAPKKWIHASVLKNIQDFGIYWQQLLAKLDCKQVIIKPRHDGCSTGVVKLSSSQDLKVYVKYLKNNAAYIPLGSFPGQQTIIEMPCGPCSEYLIEECIEVDTIRIIDNELHYKKITGWIELTVGVLEHSGVYNSLNPSITVAEGTVLSLEEKFQGGTGINLTPPPEEIVPIRSIDHIKKCIEIAASELQIQNYARVDIFFNIDTQTVILIEINSLPALTPSTVLYHQALSERSPITPVQFLEKIISTTRAIGHSAGKDLDTVQGPI